MTRVHITDNYLLNPRHPVMVNVIGAGGTGSQVVTNLARMDQSLRGLHHPGLHVRLFDPDRVSESNIGRQLFQESEIGHNKAECLITRINRFFGNDWIAVPGRFPEKEPIHCSNIYITCTDNTTSRIHLAKALQKYHAPSSKSTDYTTPLYWLDFGNAQTTGQVILGSVRRNVPQPASQKFETVQVLPTVTEYTDYSRIKDEDSGPSCSLIEALGKQDLFINSTLAQLGCDLLWKMLREGMLQYHGLYLNLDTMRVNPITV